MHVHIILKTENITGKLKTEMQWIVTHGFIYYVKTKKIQQQNVTQVSIEPGVAVIWIWCSPLWAIEACVTWQI